MPTRIALCLFMTITASAFADNDGWWLGMGCTGQGTAGSGVFTACRTSDCNGSGFLSGGSCSRTATRFTKLTFTTNANGSLRSSTRYALHTGDLFIAPALLDSEEKPLFATMSACPLSSATLNWIFVQWNSGARTMTNTYLLGSATYSAASGVTLTSQHDIDGTVYWAGPYPMPGTCTSGVYPTTSSVLSEMTGNIYFTASGMGVYKSAPGYATLFFPEYTVTLATDLGSKTAQAIAFDSRLASNTTLARVTTNAGGTVFTVEPYLDPEAGTLDTSFTDVITITATNSPRNGVLLGNIVRNGGAAKKIACIVNHDAELRVICSGESPENAAYPYTVTFTVEPPGGGGCPANYVLVPADPTVGVASDFCAAKYEMKILGDDNGSQVYNASFVPDSRAGGTPWGLITRNQARAECQTLGGDFDLISNAQWQALARNIENAYVASAYVNWSNGRQDNTPGQNNINQGNTDGTPGTLLAASDDNDPCFGTGRSNCANNTHADFRLKRTHVLSNEEVIWDLGGNTIEMTSDDTVAVSGSNGFIFAETWDPGGKLLWGPAGSYAGGGTYPKTSVPYGGFGYALLASTGGMVTRGGYYGDDFTGDFAEQGIFSANTYGDPDISVGLYYGFRCVFNAP